VTAIPRSSLLRQFDTHRLVPFAYSDEPSNVLRRIAQDQQHLGQISELDALTNEQVWAENNLLPGIGIHELVFGVPHARIINGAFTFAHPLGSRFSSPERGAWYAGFDIETSQTEVAFHKTLHLAEIGIYNDEVAYVDYLADFAGEFHDLRDDPLFLPCLSPNSYVQSQELGQHLLNAGSLGVVYPSVRYSSGTCIACFRPAAVSNVRRGPGYQFGWMGQPEPTITIVNH
jgi:RES domain